MSPRWRKRYSGRPSAKRCSPPTRTPTARTTGRRGQPSATEDRDAPRHESDKGRRGTLRSSSNWTHPTSVRTRRAFADDAAGATPDDTNEPDEAALEAFDLDGDGRISVTENARAELGIVDAQAEEMGDEPGLKGKIGQGSPPPARQARQRLSTTFKNLP